MKIFLKKNFAKKNLTKKNFRQKKNFLSKIFFEILKKNFILKNIFTGKYKIHQKTRSKQGPGKVKER